MPSELIIDQIFNSKKNPKPALAVLVDNTLGVVYFKNAVTHNFHGIYNNPIPAFLSFEQFCELYLPAGKINLTYDSR